MRLRSRGIFGVGLFAFGEGLFAEGDEGGDELVERVERRVIAGEDAEFKRALGGLLEGSVTVWSFVEGVQCGLKFGLGLAAVFFLDETELVFLEPFADGGFADTNAERRFGKDFGDGARGEAAFQEGKDAGLLCGGEFGEADRPVGEVIVEFGARGGETFGFGGEAVGEVGVFQFAFGRIVDRLWIGDFGLRIFRRSGLGRRRRSCSH